MPSPCSRLSRSSTALQSTTLRALAHGLPPRHQWIRFESSVQSYPNPHVPRKGRVCSIVYVPNPSTADPFTIIRKLPQVSEKTQAGLPNALILATPGLAKWFEQDHPFLRDAMNWIYKPQSQQEKPISIVGIVDGLPAPEYFERWQDVVKVPSSLADGIAICLISEASLLRRGLPFASSETPAILCLKMHASKRRSGVTNFEENFTSGLLVPFANTLFVNGSQHTVFENSWQLTPDGKSFEAQGEASPLQSIEVRATGSPRTCFNFNVPLYALTRPRKVTSSMGNVVREIEGYDGEPIRASAELEAVVPRFLEWQKTDGENSNIQVFANVMPPGFRKLRGAEPFVEQDSTLAEQIALSPEVMDQHATQFQDSRASYSRLYTRNLHTTIWNEGQLYRVTSGGGGWGKKAGLLSLDPAVDFTPMESTMSSIFPDIDSLDEQPDKLTRIDATVPAGHTIQFFAAKVLEPIQPHITTQKTREASFLASLKPEGLSEIDPQRWAFGSTASYEEIQQAEEPGARSKKSPTLIVLPDCFGAMSHNGIALEVDKKPAKDQTGSTEASNNSGSETSNRSKIDTPFSLFRVGFDVKLGTLGEEFKQQVLKYPPIRRWRPLEEQGGATDEVKTAIPKKAAPDTGKSEDIRYF